MSEATEQKQRAEATLAEAAKSLLQAGGTRWEAMAILFAVVNLPPDQRLLGPIWSESDIQAVFDVSPVEAAAFMDKYRRRFKDRMIELGWEVWISLGEEEGLSFHADEEETSE